MSILLPILYLFGIGLLCGILLAVFARYFKVEEDPRIGDITSLLPGANCGGCGFAGCANYASSIVNDDAPLDKCSVCTAENLIKIAKLIGKDPPVGSANRKVAFVKCGGTLDLARYRFAYDGITDCDAALATAGGAKSCEFGCLGFGSCVRSCPQNAIKIVNGLAVVNNDFCIGCGRCASVCPRNVIELISVNASLLIACNSPAPGREVRGVCKVGCIKCNICKKVPADVALTKCPTKCIRKI